MCKKGPIKVTKSRNGEKGPTKHKMKVIDPKKKILLRKYFKVPTAYKTLNPALGKLLHVQDVPVSFL